MFRFLTRSSKPRLSSLSRRVRPGLECLEARDCPAAPQISLTAAVGSGKLVQLSGMVMEDHPATVTVSFSGVMSGSVTVAANSSFSYTAPASALGNVSAIGVDGQGLSSNTALAAVNSASPVLTLMTTTNGSQTSVTGHVDSPHPDGLTVTLGGTASGSVTTDADGNFSLLIDASKASALTATAADAWGQTSNKVGANYGTTAPQISNFTAEIGPNNTLIISGQVSAPNLQGMTVQLGGMPSLNNRPSLTVNDQGWFNITITLQPGEDGTATAEATDANGNSSGTVESLVR